VFICAFILFTVRVRVIVNPTAGGSRAGRAQPGVSDYLRKHGCRAEFVHSQSSDHVRRLAAEGAAAGFDCIAALGGDGTFHHTVKGAFGSGAAFAFLPAGNGNDIARGLGIPGDPVDAARILLRCAPRPVDVLRARFAGDRDELFLGVGGLGLDAETAQLVNSRFQRLPGVMRYLAAALWTLTHFDPLPVVCSADGAPEVRMPVMFAAVANSPTYGSGLWIAPAATMHDAHLDVTLVGALSWLEVLEAIPILVRSGDIRWPAIRRLRARSVLLSATRPALFHGDGEVLGQAPVQIDCLPGAVRIHAPAPAA